jgi:hypothetical protein
MRFCARCDDCRWVCEAHPDRSWLGPRACDCGAAGEPCPVCNASEPPQLPAGFKLDVDKGWRH